MASEVDTHTRTHILRRNESDFKKPGTRLVKKLLVFDYVTLLPYTKDYGDETKLKRTLSSRANGIFIVLYSTF